MFIKRVTNLQRRNTISTSQIMWITLLLGVISVDCRNGIKTVDILRGENRMILNSTAQVFFYVKWLSLKMAKKVKVKVKCTLVQALRLCTGRTAHWGSRGIALLFHDHGTRKGVWGQRQALAALYPRERHGTHCTGGWMGRRAGLKRCGKSRPHRNSIPRTVQPVASRYTDWVTWPTKMAKGSRNM